MEADGYCQTCQAFVPLCKGQTGQCHRQPPGYGMMGNLTHSRTDHDAFPVVSAQSWCLEYRPRQVEPQ